MGLTLFKVAYSMRLSIPRRGSDRGGGLKNRQNCLNALVDEIHQFKNFLWGVK